MEEPRGAPAEIAELFTQKEEVSLTRDIAPVIFKHHAYEVLNNETCITVSYEIAQALAEARHNGIVLECIPLFSPELTGCFQLSDMVYKRISRY